MGSSMKSPSAPEITIRCGGECGRGATIVDASKIERPLLRLVAGLLSGADLYLGYGWEFDAASKKWFCVHCRRRRRLLKVLH
jgi:hypothetical protein